MTLQAALTALALPPLGLILFALAALPWRVAGARVAAALALVSVLVFATPAVSSWLLLRASDDHRPPPGPAPLAIVILGAETTRGAEGAEVGPLTLERLRRGSELQRGTGLPVLVTGGVVAPETPPIAQLMARSLERDFRIVVRWEETEAGDTAGNAELSAAFLKRESLDTVYLVTHGWHMPRARDSFERAGIKVHAAPVQHAPSWDGWRPGDWLPRPDYLLDSWYALRELLGRIVYTLRDGRVA